MSRLAFILMIVVGLYCALDLAIELLLVGG